jgi:hypothetical protein
MKYNASNCKIQVDNGNNESTKCLCRRALICSYIYSIDSKHPRPPLLIFENKIPKGLSNSEVKNLVSTEGTTPDHAVAEDNV